MKKIKSAYFYLFISLMTVVLCFVWSGFSVDAFLFDDNRMQWYPVMEKAFEQFFETGRMPDYCFYIGKGLPISEPGYYGTTNPLLMFSYVAAHLFPGVLNTLLVYIIICCVAGNLFLFSAVRRFGYGDWFALLAVGMLTSSSGILYYFGWYYVFNNWLFVPMILYVIAATSNAKIGYLAMGIVLAFEIYCGNIQYTFFHYILYGIIAVLIIAVCDRSYFKKLLSNVGVGIVLSLPIVTLCMKASQSFGDANEFMSSRYPIFSLIINAAYPSALFHAVESSFSLEGMSLENLARTSKNIGFFGAAFISIVVWCICAFRSVIRKKSQDDKQSFLTRLGVPLIKLVNCINKPSADRKISALIGGIVVAVLFFINYADGGFFALIMSKLPVVNKFRYLFKALFVALPLVSVIGAAAIYSLKGKKKTVVSVICTGFVLIGLVNNVFVYQFSRNLYTCDDQKTFSEEMDYAQEMIRKNSLELKQYRSVCLILENKLEDEVFDPSKSVSRNYPAYLETFTLSAYEISLPDEVKEQFDLIYDPEGFLTSYGNLCYISHFLLVDDDSIDRLEDQLISNSIKYIFMEKESAIKDPDVSSEKTSNSPERTKTEAFEEILGKLKKVSVVDKIDINEFYYVYVLDGIRSLCASEDGTNVDINDCAMDQISFIAEHSSQDYKLSFTFNDNLTAYGIDDSGNRHDIGLTAADDGNIIVHNDIGDGEIFIQYEDFYCSIAVILSWINLLLLVSVLLYIDFDSRKSRIR